MTRKPPTKSLEQRQEEERDRLRAFASFQETCSSQGIGCQSFSDHWEVFGKKRRVKWWPFGRSRIARIQGLSDPRKGATEKEVISWAQGGSVRAVEQQGSLFQTESKEGTYD